MTRPPRPSSRDRPGPIGLDISPTEFVAAQLTRGGGGGAGRGAPWRLAAAVRLPRQDRDPVPNAEALLRLAEVLDRRGFAGRNVVLAVPVGSLLTGLIDLPPRGSGAPIEQLARMELARVHRREAASFELACWDVPQPPRAAAGTSVFAAGCAVAEASPLVEAFDRADWNVAALDTRSWALVRACRPVMAPEPGVLQAVLDLGETAALAAIVLDGVPVYERVIADGSLGVLRQRLAAALDEPEADIDQSLADAPARGPADPPADTLRDEARPIIDAYGETLLREVRAALVYASHRYAGASAGCLLITGAGAALPRLSAALSRGLRETTRAVAPADLLVDCRDTRPALVPAIGLAMHPECQP